MDQSEGHNNNSLGFLEGKQKAAAEFVFVFLTVLKYSYEVHH